VINPVLQLQDGAANEGTLRWTLPLGAIVIGTGTTTNATTILVPGTGTMGPASPYPSTILLTNVVGTVTKVTATVSKLAHSFPRDIDILLVGPTGTNVILESGCGSGVAITNVTLTFDDDAAAQLPQDSGIVSGTYQPSGTSASFEDFYPPAPTGQHDTVLSVFKGQNPNGTWSLYAQDVAANDSGSIVQGWQLSITTSNLVCCSGATPPTPVMQYLSVSNGMSTVTWSSLPGQTYRLQYSLSLSSGTWNTLWPDITATNITSCTTVPVFSATQSFYRVLTVP
jgi:subtilisin-like proprotein convertase family protein